ncbi:MAG TPA: glycosyltransferase family 4 protein, partial [Acidimicrobiales bacterium]|nr:glycosyltransferase family 4 protein [Acidimicrobiales bacterium]
DAQPRWIGASDLTVMACRSRWLGLEQEGFGIVFVEAAACGLAQIAGRSGGSHDAVRDGETGIVLQNSRSVRELAGAIESLLLDDERRARYGRQARAMVLANFSWDTLALGLGAGLEPFDHYKATSSLA